LGLAIARWIAESHGGTIHVANRDGGGTVATVILPMRES
jgi:signal transduction histidine kinase